MGIMDVEQYLNRIGINEVKECSLEELARLQYQHTLHVPFENLDVVRQVPIALDVEAFYNKVVVSNRGGFCYELNGLFRWLLLQLGFSCYLTSATINRPDDSWAKTESHACIVVELDQPYIVDVGFGDSARNPLPLNGQIQRDVSGIYRVCRVNAQVYDVERKQTEDQQWSTQVRMNTEHLELQNFEAVCHFNQTSPQAPFTQKEIVTIATPDGRLTFSGDLLTITGSEGKQRFSVNEKQRSSILKKYFGIQL